MPSNYINELTQAMTWLGEQHDTVFIGQQVRYPGNALFQNLSGVPMEKRIEMPVAEDMQMGISLGMALTGKVVISIFPRMDFLLCAMNQLVNHLDKLEDFTHGQYKAKVIIRVGIGSTKPLDPGPQHRGDYTEALKVMLKHVRVTEVGLPESVLSAYQQAYKSGGAHLIVEGLGLYGS